jgi:hypothetical protein
MKTNRNPKISADLHMKTAISTQKQVDPHEIEID